MIHAILNPGSSIKSSAGLEHLLRDGIHPESAALDVTADLLDLDGLRVPPPLPLREGTTQSDKRAAVRGRTPPAPPVTSSQHRKPPPPPQAAQAKIRSAPPAVKPNVFAKPPPPPEVAIAQLHSNGPARCNLPSQQKQVDSHDPALAVVKIPCPSVAKATAQTESNAKVTNGPIHSRVPPPPIPAHPHSTNLAEKLKHRTPPIPQALKMKPPPRGVGRRRPPAPMKR